MNTGTQAILFQPRNEPNENAFSLLVPQGWLVEGGIQRANLMNQVVSAQTIEAKVDFALKRDPQGSVMLRVGPDMKYCDMRASAAGMFGLFPPGSNYMGCIVWPLLSPENFILQVMYRWAHPNGSQPQVLEQRPEPELVQKHQLEQQRMGFSIPGSQYQAATLIYTYQEAGSTYQEMATTGIEYLGPAAGGMWSNKGSIYRRAPAAEFAGWLPVFKAIENSLTMNPQWVLREIQSQDMLNRAFLNAQQADQMRSQRALDTQRFLQDADRQIAEHRSITQAEIRNDAYLNMTNQEEYMNPYTGKPDLGSNQWNYRWVTESGEVFYSDNESDDPNQGSLLNRSDWKSTPIRPRGPQD